MKSRDEMKASPRKITDKEWEERNYQKKKQAALFLAALTIVSGIILIAFTVYYHRVIAPERLSRNIFAYQYWIYILALSTSGLSLLFSGLLKAIDVKRKFY